MALRLVQKRPKLVMRRDTPTQEDESSFGIPLAEYLANSDATVAKALTSMGRLDALHTPAQLRSQKSHSSPPNTSPPDGSANRGQVIQLPSQTLGFTNLPARRGIHEMTESNNRRRGRKAARLIKYLTFVVVLATEILVTASGHAIALRLLE